MFGSSVYIPVPSVGKCRGVCIRPDPTAELVWLGDSGRGAVSKASQTLLRITDAAPNVPQLWSDPGGQQVWSRSGVQWVWPTSDAHGSLHDGSELEQ